MLAQFAGHEICDSHPTATGQKGGYLPVFTAAATAAGQ
jgi:hypothetical protein